MGITEEILDQCWDKLTDLPNAKLMQLIFDKILPYMTKQELIDLIQDQFIDDDWEWFYENYVKQEG